VYRRVGRVNVRGLDGNDRVIVKTVNTRGEDLPLALPLWAGIPSQERAEIMMKRTLLNTERFDRPFGMPALPASPAARTRSALRGAGGINWGQALSPVVSTLRLGSGQAAANPEAATVATSVHMPWNTLIGEGMLAYGFRAEAAHLTRHLMKAIIQSLKQNRAFYQRYDAERGTGIGERNALQGLAPVGLFLQALGVTVLSPRRVRLEGKNVFPWPVTIKYKGLRIVRNLDRTVITFPNGEMATVEDPAPCIVSI
jgi:hypothetical protein